MAAPLKKEKIDEIIKYRKKGLSYDQIAKKTGLHRQSVARKCRQYESGQLSARVFAKKRLDNLIELLANDRMTMYRKDVAKKHGISESYVATLLTNHPLRFQFYKSKFNDGTPKKEKPTPKTKKVKAIKKPTPVISKKKKVDKKPLPEESKPIVIKDKGPTRTLTIDRKTSIMVPLSDKRKDSVIIQEWLDKRGKKPKWINYNN